MGGGSGCGGQDPRWLRLKVLEAGVKALKKEIRHHPPTIADYGRLEPCPTCPVPGAPPEPPPESDPGVPIREGRFLCCWRAIWLWHRCKEKE